MSERRKDLPARVDHHTQERIQPATIHKDDGGMLLRVEVPSYGDVDGSPKEGMVLEITRQPYLDRYSITISTGMNKHHLQLCDDGTELVAPTNQKWEIVGKDYNPLEEKIIWTLASVEVDIEFK